MLSLSHESQKRLTRRIFGYTFTLIHSRFLKQHHMPYDKYFHTVQDNLNLQLAAPQIISSHSQ